MGEGASGHGELCDLLVRLHHHHRAKLRTGMPGVPIPYKSTNEMMVSVASEQTLFAIGDGPPTVPLVQAGKMRAFAVNGGGELAGIARWAAQGRARPAAGERAVMERPVRLGSDAARDQGQAGSGG